MNIHKGCISITNKENKNNRFVHVIVDSETHQNTMYYVTVDSWNGQVIGCSCPQCGLFPFTKCKHQKAVINKLFN